MQPPTIDDVRAAQPRVYQHVSPSPLLRHSRLEDWLGCQAWVKHENRNPTGAFKIRGGINLVAQMNPDERRRGVMVASTGNHGQSLAFACHLHGVCCRVVVPVNNNPDKIAAMRALGADVIEFGTDFDEAREWVEARALEEGVRYVHNANEPQLIAGVGTYALEIFEALRGVDFIFVPIGGGSGAAACGIVRDALGEKTRIIGVQAERADAFAQSWRGPVRVTRERVDTIAEGLATRTTFDLTFSMLKTTLDDVVTVSEDELRAAMAASLEYTHHVAEASGAAPLAAIRRFRPPKDATVVCVMSGGNVDKRTLSRTLA